MAVAPSAVWYFALVSNAPALPCRKATASLPLPCVS